MIKTLQLKIVLLLCLIMGAGNAWGDVVYYTLDTTGSTQTDNNGYANTGSVTVSGIAWALEGNGQINPWRLGGKKITNTNRAAYTTTAMGSAITKIDLTVGSATITVNSLKLIVASDANFSTVIDEVSATYSASSKITFEPTSPLTNWATSAYYKFVFNVTNSTNSNKYVEFSKVEFYKAEESTTNPSINASNPDALAYDAISGTIEYSITNPVDGGSISASTEADWISSFDYNTSGEVNFTTTANSGTTARTATVTLTYTYNSNETVTKDVTVTQAAAPYSTIPSLFNAATSTATNVLVTFNNWVVSGVSTNGKNVFVTDNSGNGFVIYSSSDQSSTYAVGNTLSGTAVSCSLKLNSGYAQITNLNANDLTIGTGGSVTEANIAMADLAGVNTGVLVSYENLTCSIDNSKYYLSDGSTTLQVYNSLYAFGTTLQAGHKYNITGIYQQYGETKEILPRSAADIEEIVTTTPTITTGSNSLTGFIYVEGNGPSTAQNFTVQGANLTANISLSLGDNSDFEMSTSENSGYTNSLTLNQSNGTVATTTVYVRLKADLTVSSSYSGTITLTSMDAAQKTVSLSGSVTEPEAPHVTWDLAVASYESDVDANLVTWTSDYATMTNAKGTGTTSVNNYLGGDSNSRQSSRFYTNNILVLTPASGYAITSVVFTATSSGYASALANSTWTNASASVSTEDNKIVTVTPTDGTKGFSAKIGGTCGFTGVTVYYTAITSVPLTIKENFPATTFSSNNALDFTNVSGVTAYIITDDDGSTTAVTTVPANTGLYIEGAAGTYNIPLAASTATLDDVDDNKLIATTAGTTYKTGEANKTYYAYGHYTGNSEDKYAFMKVKTTGLTPGAGKALLAIDTPVGGAKELIEINGGATSIDEELRMTDEESAGAIYDLSGRRVIAPTKGLYIVNGKKLMVK